MASLVALRSMVLPVSGCGGLSFASDGPGVGGADGGDAPPIATGVAAPTEGACAIGGDPADHRNRRGQDVAVDVAGGGVEPAGRVDAQDHGGRVLGGGAG